MQRVQLSRLKWVLSGWDANCWRIWKGEQLAGRRMPDIGPVAARFPGSVQQALLEAGLIPDWHVGLNSRQIEWIENCHWDYSTLLPAGLGGAGVPVRLVCQGLDHNGTILIDGREVAQFKGTLIPHVFDLTEHLSGERKHTLSIIYEGAPDEQGYAGYTSRSRHFKPRFNYKWDWCPRIVTLGAWDSAWIEVGGQPRLTNVRPRPILHEDLMTGELSVQCRVWSAKKTPVRLEAKLTERGKSMGTAVLETSSRAGEQIHTLRFPSLTVRPWQPNGQGESVLYDLAVELNSTGPGKDGDTYIDTWQSKTGFKNVQWLPCEGAPKTAPPWICSVNGQPIFLQGVNWSPIRANYQDLTRADYAKRLRAYQKMGCNILRVWGGGLIERQDFYDLCNELGLLVWQEFPVTSSGVENTPPTDPDVIGDLLQIAASEIERRAGNPCLLLWCGGNELTLPPEQPGTIPSVLTLIDESHPCIKALGKLTRKLDPDHRFLPASPYGPAFSANAKDFGKGMHHDVHGPWNVAGTMEEWRDFFDRDDSLMRSEVGCPSASPLDILQRYKGEFELWPPSEENRYWRHGSQWWLNWERFKPLITADGSASAEASLVHYIKLSQKLQADALSYATRVRKRAFPRFGGIMFWMGHDTYPCPANTALFDFYGRPKPAARALAKVFHASVEELQEISGPTYSPMPTLKKKKMERPVI